MSKTPVQIRDLIDSITGNVRASEGAGTTTLLFNDNRHQVFTLSAARTCVLPTTGVAAGDKFVLENNSAFLLTVQASDLSGLTTATSGAYADHTGGYCIVRAKQAVPTTAAHWQVVDAEDFFSHTVNFAGAIPSTGTTVKYTRKRKTVTVLIQQFTATANAANAIASSIASAGQVPTRFRPSTLNQYMSIAIINNGAISASPGTLSIETAGDISIRRDFSNNAFTNTGTAGLASGALGNPVLTYVID